MKRNLIAFRVDDIFLEEIKSYALKNNISVSALISLALTKYIK